jgi:hypothetical protein
VSFEKKERVLEHGSSMNQKKKKNLKQQKIKRKSMIIGVWNEI